MIRHIKSADAPASNFQDQVLPRSVEALLDKVRMGGDSAIRTLANRFDGLDRPTYQLSLKEIDATAAQRVVASERLEESNEA